jgi:S1-C subfamily serine protease
VAVIRRASIRVLALGALVSVLVAGGALRSGSASGASVSAKDVAQQVDPALVDIRTNLALEDAAAAGTGIVIGSNGLVLTNNHVIRGATSISVRDIGNDKTYKGTVLGYDPTHDVALVQLSGASGLKTATIGGAVSVGEAVTAIGNAGGVGGTPSVASGTVTGTGKSITASDEGANPENLTGLIETNADLQPGDSGGPLVDAAGQVLGMDTAASEGFTFSGESTGAAYAIPIAHALAIVEKIKAGHASATTHIGATPFLGVGVEFSDANDDGYNPFAGFGDAATSGVTGDDVDSVVSGSPAAKLGLQEGDVITKFAGHAVTTEYTLTNQLLSRKPGDSVAITWVDVDGLTHHGTLKLASGPPQ